MDFSPYPLDRRQVRYSQLDSTITAAVLDQEQLSFFNHKMFTKKYPR